MLQVGDVIGGRLRIDRMLGVGGFGVVAAATHLELRHEVAIKMLKPELTDDAEIVDRFLREARAVAGLRTEHVCRVFDIGRTDAGAPYIVMELLQGSDLASLIRHNPPPPATAVDFVMQVLVALAEAHPRGIVHRDLKPPNLFVMRRTDGSPLVKVLDFGIAKAVDELRLTHSSTMLGSPQYMSPEQMTTPKDIDARTDIWSIGVTLYHLLARRLPFPSAQIGELAVLITSHAPAPIEIDPGLRAVLWKCLEKDRAARFQDVAQLAAALVPFGGPTAQGYAGLVRAPSSPPQLPAPITHAPSVPNAVTVGTVATGGGAMPTSGTIPTGGPMSTGGASLAARMSAPMPAPAASPPKSRALLFGALAVALVGGGAVVGYLALSSNQPSSATTARESPAVMPDARVVGAARDAAVVVTTVDARVVDPQLSEFERDLLRLEGRIDATPKISPDLPGLYMSAAQMACGTKDVDKAKFYFAKLVDGELRKRAIEACRAYKIEL